MRRVLLSSISYFAIVFAVGFVVGTIRVVLLEPWMGKTYAVACEMPLMLITIIVVARWLPSRLGLKMKVLPLAMMGLGALVLQQLADFAFGSLFRGIALEEQLAYLSTPPGFIYLVLLVIFLGAPLAANLGRLRV